MGWGTLNVEKLGRVVIVSACSLGWNKEVPAWSKKTCGTVPQGLRPKAKVQAAGVHDGGSCYMEIGTDGVVSMCTRGNAFLASGTFEAQAVYFVG